MEPTASDLKMNINGSTTNWFVGDSVLAPISGDGKLSEATIKSISTDENGENVALLRFSNFNEEIVPITRLQKKNKCERWKGFIFDDEDLEKPFFYDKQTLGPKISLKLCEGGIYVPHTINRYLRDYQRDGIQFICKHYFRGNGCILGDDMGLGKTVQVISFLAAVLHKTGTREDIENNMPEFVLKTMRKESKALNDKIFLVIAPLSVLYNWKNELDAWGYFRVYILHGNKKDHAFSCIRRNKCEIALSTYETVRLCLDDINSIEWSAVFVDEAHKIKNPKAQITQALKALKCKVRIGLTGTILQNNMDELWCVMDWAIPGCLGSRARFKEDFGNPIEFGQRHGATKRELAFGRKSVRQLAKHMSFWFLRRTKSLISDQLPRKEDRVVYCSLTEFQKSVYKAVLETEDIKLVMRGWDPCDCNSGRKRKNCCYKCNREGSTVRQIYFSYLAVLRKISNHVALLQPNENTSKMQQSTVRGVCEHVFGKFPEFVEQSKEAAFATISDPKYSGKMKVLQRLLDHFRRNKDKVLLFSFSTKLLDVLERHCMATGLDYRRLDGKTKTEERVKIVKEFNSLQDINICLVSTMAGGLGLNFVGANVVIMFDPTWNPANDLQAIDRAYRIGQCRNVQVFRLISLGTVEEIIYLRQLYKQQLHCAAVGSENARRYFNAVQGSKEHLGEIFGVRNLFSLRIGGSCLTRDIIQREGQVEAGVMTAITQLREEPPVERQEAITDGNTIEEANLNLLVQPNKENRAALRKSEQFFDFSSDSETEPSMKKTKMDPVEINHHRDTGGQLALVQCGFARFFDRKGSSSEESSESDDHSNIEILQKQSTGTGTSLVAAVAQGKDGYWGRDSHLNAQTVKGDGGHSKQAKHKHSSSTESEGKAEPPIDVGVNNSRDENNVVSTSGVFRQKKKMLVKRKSHLSFLSTDSEDSSNENNSSKKKALSSNISDCLGAKPCIVNGSPKITQGKTLSHVAKLKTQLNEEESISDESDNIEISTESPDVMSSPPDDSAEAGRRNVKSNSGAIVKKVTAQYNIEEFSSSEDDITTKRSRLNANDEISRSNRGKKCKKVQLGIHNRPSESAKDLTVPKHQKWRQSHKEQLASVSKLLGDVEEVAFIHSNQRVVGSSKAENQMTHTAIRDVFELKQYSQVPANITCHTVQTDRKGQQAAGTSTLIRDAPTGICRKQLSGLAPVENLPVHALISTSHQQPKMLRDSSLTQCPRSNNIQSVRPPEAEREDNITVQRSKGYASTGHSDRKANKTINFICGASAGRIKSLRKKNLKEMTQCFEMQDEINSQKHDYMSGQPHKKHNLMADKSASDFAEGFDDRISMGCSSPSTAAVSKSRLDGSGTSSGAVKPQQQCEERGPPPAELKGTPDNNHEITQLKTDFITELLGDTSILDPLFNRKKNLTAKPKKASGDVPKGKSKPKDFWDFLNKSSEEYATTLTDFSVIERLCESAPLKTKEKEKEWDGSLWKKNEKFLWKKT
ncbi:DNA excision repair protein ERCC-6-like 2 isoform X1 [Hemitrygon akajei]|uniref:DNA excision repair protein ERCC-6-like 2 isoform X1 n=1 Tax=Hemitrygon akajei TaxID=2704970 RepID=UPI003BFA2568